MAWKATVQANKMTSLNGQTLPRVTRTLIKPPSDCMSDDVRGDLRSLTSQQTDLKQIKPPSDCMFDDTGCGVHSTTTQQIELNTIKPPANGMLDHVTYNLHSTTSQDPDLDPTPSIISSGLLSSP